MDQISEMEDVKDSKEPEIKSKLPKELPKKEKKQKRKKRFRLPPKLIASMWAIVAIATFAVGCIGLIQLMAKLYNKELPDWSYALIVTPLDRQVQMVIYGFKGSRRNLNIRMKDNLTFYEIFHWDHINNAFQYNFRRAERKIPFLSRSSSPVIFAGGGDMRLLRNSTLMGNKTGIILEDVERLFKSSRLKFIPKSVRILNDWEEALHGWITLNYLTDYMTKGHEKELAHEIDVCGIDAGLPHSLSCLGRQPIKAKRDIFTTRETLGVLDLGHTSLHISYEIPKVLESTPDAVKAKTRVITLYGRVYYIYTQSLICHGSSRLMDMYMGYILEKTNYKDWNDFRYDGCFMDFTSNSQRPVIYIENLMEPCVSVRWPNLFYKSKGRRGIMRLGGNIDPLKCEKDVKEMLDKCNKYFPANDCPTYDYSKRPYNVTFVGINEFAKYAELARLKGGETEEQFNNIRKKICKVTHILDMKNEFPSNIASDRDYHSLCLILTYLHKFLKETIKLTDVEWKKLRYEQEVDETKVSWYLGYVANVTGTLPTTSPFHDQISLTDILVQGLVYAAILSCSTIAVAFALRKSNTLALRALQLPQ